MKKGSYSRYILQFLYVCVHGKRLNILQNNSIDFILKYMQQGNTKPASASRPWFGGTGETFFCHQCWSRCSPRVYTYITSPTPVCSEPPSITLFQAQLSKLELSTELFLKAPKLLLNSIFPSKHFYVNYLIRKAGWQYQHNFPQSCQTLSKKKTLLSKSRELLLPPLYHHLAS